ncbi:MAG: glutathione S-transferase N-terminal domain-containing protein [Pseudomonadota bacterium]
MLLHDVSIAPNPRRVRIFLAEKGIEVPMRQVDMMAGENRSPEFLAKNPSGQIPVLELDDGTCISESVAICRYFEATHPEPALFGATPTEIGLIEMRNRVVELGLLATAVGVAWVNGPIVAKMAPGRFQQIPEAKTQAEARARSFYKRLNRELEQSEWIAKPGFSIADITTLCTLEFAATRVDLMPDESLTALHNWWQRMKERSSYGA